MSRLQGTFAELKNTGRAGLVTYVTAGDPDAETSHQILVALARGGADVIEVGVPFSDPVADGPVNQRAAARALAAGTKLSALLELVARRRDELGVPIVLFTYYNPIHARGVERFAEQAAASGVDGVLCVDLPPEEAEDRYTPALRAQGIDTVFLLAPTSDKARMASVAAASTGFVYYVSRTGVTGERELLTKTLPKEVKRVRRKVKLPVAVGFGISTPEQVAAVGGFADAVVVGSALVRVVGEGGPDVAQRLEARARELAAPLLAEPKRRWA